MLNQNQNKILIKSKGGQMKTVSLGMADIVRKPVIINKGQIQSVSLKDENVAGKENEENEQIIEKNIAKNDSNNQTVKLDLKDKQEEALKMPNLVAKEMVMPAFYFNREDEEEVAKFKNKDNLTEIKKKQVILDYIVEEIIKKSGVKIDDRIFDRLKRVVESRLREIRDLIETKEALMRQRQMGGAGLDVEQARNILKIIEEYRLKIHDGENLEEEAVKIQTVPKIIKEEQEDVLSLDKKVVNEEKPMVKENRINTVNLIKSKPTSQEVYAVKTRVEENKKEPSGLEAFFKNSPAIGVENNYQARMIAGPIEELASISLDYFRQLGKTPEESTIKIKHKIELLQDESYEKKMDGIKSWRQSPVYKNYLSIGRACVEEGMGVAEVINERQKRNEPCLTTEEFDAVADLNEELAY